MLGIVAPVTPKCSNYVMVDNNHGQKKQSTVSANYAQTANKTSAIYFKASAMPVKMSNVPYKQKFFMPANNQTGYASFAEVVDDFERPMSKVIGDFNQRANKEKQFLNWVSLPQAQLAENEAGVSHLEEVYSQALELKKQGDKEKPLVVLGIGGSKHTAEFLLNMMNVPKGKVLFYSDIDPLSYESFKKELGGDVRNANYLVVSKSGTTFETKDAFERFKNEIKENYRQEGYSEAQAQALTEKHFAICTDKKPTEKNLRGQIGNTNGKDNNYIKELYIHDDVGGRYSMFDDPGLFTLAYAGVQKNTIERILNGAIVATQKSTNPDNIADNQAAHNAIFNVFSRVNGFTMAQHQFFGKFFEGGGENWAKQLYLESLKDFDYAVGTAPASMHYATEGQFSPENRDKYHTIMTVMNQNISQNYKRYTDAIAATYNETTPTKLEILDVENGAVKPESIGEYIQTKHFETVYMGMLRREIAKPNSNKAFSQLPEILQPAVETYKNKFKPGSPYELHPGE